jgi:hypothetical protein
MMEERYDTTMLTLDSRHQTLKKVQSTSGVDCILMLVLANPNLANFFSNKKY